jgi:pimeloyl-ACP methyl ester carboxylesterase
LLEGKEEGGLVMARDQRFSLLLTLAGLWLSAAAVCSSATGCFSSSPGDDDGAGTPDAGIDPSVTPADCADTALVVYRDDLAAHPGCSTEGLAYTPATIPGYQCAAKAYPVTDEDTTKPIILLVHGNSDGTGGWEAFSDPSCDPPGAMQGQPMLAERLGAAGYRVYAVDMRSNRTQLTGSDPADCMGPTCNVAHTMDHGWGVPIVMHFIRSVAAAHPDRQLALIGHSFGVTVIRDALRRLDVNEHADLWPRIDEVILLSGGNHGVSMACGFSECGVNTTMRGRAACQIGNRDAWEPNCWSLPLSGPAGAWETPCADGDSAFGRTGACGGHAVQYTTIVISNDDAGTPQDICVSEQAAMLQGADNETLAGTSIDESDYFLCGVLETHFASQRSLEAMNLVLDRLAD